MTSELDNGPAQQGRYARLGAKLLDLAVRVRTSSLRAMIPRPLRTLGYHLLPQRELERRTWEAGCRAQLASIAPAPLRTSVTLGIVKDAMFEYGNYEAACLELGVPYKLIDIAAPDWIEQVKESGCAGFLVWPSNVSSVEKRLFDDRLRVLSEEMRRPLFPSYKALWLYESKVRTNDWLNANQVPHPRTWVFWDRDEAMSFVEAAELPLVFKTDLGSSAKGVEIVRTRRHAKRLIDLCFAKGYVSYRHDRRDRMWGSIIFQEYIANANEWRVIRMGDSYFGHRKVRHGDFHSGTRLVEWYTPPVRLLQFCSEVTDQGPFLSMDMDVFETADGRYLVNEFHPVFGYTTPYEMLVNGKAGRFVPRQDKGSWEFEEGIFCQNGCCNLRVALLMEMLGSPVDWVQPEMGVTTADYEASRVIWARGSNHTLGGR